MQTPKRWKGLRHTLSVSLLKLSGKPPLAQKRLNSLSTTMSESLRTPLATSLQTTLTRTAPGHSMHRCAYSTSEIDTLNPEIRTTKAPEPYTPSSLPEPVSRSKSTSGSMQQLLPDSEGATVGMGQDSNTIVTAAELLESVKVLLPFVPHLLSSQLAEAVPEHPSLVGVAALGQSDTIRSVAKVRNHCMTTT